MNKLRLRFQDPSLEESFQQEKQQTLQNAVIQSLCYGGITTLIINFIEASVIGKFSNMYEKISMFIAFSLTIIIKRKYPKQTNKLLFILNLLLIILEYNSPFDDLNYQGYLVGSNFMLCHAVAGVGIDFLPSLFSSVAYAAFRILITNYTSNKIDFTQLFFTVFSACTYSFFVYKIEQWHRSSFLLKFKDNNWESLIPKILSKPCAILRFDNETLLFSQISANSSSDYFSKEEITRQFINSSAIYKENSSLSAYLYKIYNECEQQQSLKFMEFHLTISFQCKKIKMKIVLQRFEEIYFFLILESEDDELKNQKLNYKNQILKIQKSHLRQISVSQNIMKRYLNSNNPQLILKYRLSLYQYQILKQQKLFFSETLLNVSEFLEKFLSSLRKYYNLTFQIQDNVVQITSKQLLILFLLEILKNSNTENNISMNLCVLNKKIKLLIIGIPKINQSSLYRMCKQLLIESHSQSMSNHCFILNQTPICSYKNVKLKICEKEFKASEILQFNN